MQTENEDYVFNDFDEQLSNVPTGTDHDTDHDTEEMAQTNGEAVADVTELSDASKLVADLKELLDKKYSSGEFSYFDLQVYHGVKKDLISIEERCNEFLGAHVA